MIESTRCQMSYDLAPIIVVALLYGTTALLMWQPVSGRRLAAYVMSIYGMVCVFGGVLLCSQNAYQAPGFLPLLHVYGMVLLLVWPIYKFREGNIQVVRFSQIRVYLLFSYFVAIVSIVGYLSHLSDTISQVIVAFKHESFQVAYRATRVADSDKSGLSASNALLVVASAMDAVVPFLFFSLLSIPKHYLLKLTLFVCGVFSLLNCVATAGRNGLIFFIIVFTGTTMLFWNVLSAKVRKVVLASGIGIVLGLVSIVIMITLSRFNDNENSNPMDSVLDYAGQPMLNFSEYIYAAKTTSNGDMNFPLFRAVLGLNYSTSLHMRNHTWEPSLGVPLGVFYTFVGDFLLDFGGYISLFLFATLALFVARNTGYCACSVELHAMFLIYILFIFISQGVFYYTYKTIGGNLKIMFMALSYMIFSYCCRQKQ
jgi:oligosaccharide repeat unit polymerase